VTQVGNLLVFGGKRTGGLEGSIGQCFGSVREKPGQRKGSFDEEKGKKQREWKGMFWG